MVNNGKTVIEKAAMPGVPEKGSIVLQHHGGLQRANQKMEFGLRAGAGFATSGSNRWIN